MMADSPVRLLREHLNRTKEAFIDLVALFGERKFPSPNLAMKSRQENVFNPTAFMERIVVNIWKQQIRLCTNVWRLLFAFYDRFENPQFAQTRSRQIGFEILYAYSRCDADQIAEQCGLSQADANYAQERSSLFEEDFLNMILKCVGEGLNINLVPVVESNLIKQRLLSPSIRASIREALVKLNFSALALVRFDIDANYYALVNDISIYQTTIWNGFEAVALTDGFMFNRLSAPVQGRRPNSHEAYMITTAAHEFGHYVARKISNNYGFSTPTSNLQNGTEPRRDIFDQNIYLELGRLVEYHLFGRRRPDWKLTDEWTANEFLHRLDASIDIPIMTINEAGANFPPFIPQAAMNISSAPV